MVFVDGGSIPRNQAGGTSVVSSDWHAGAFQNGSDGGMNPLDWSLVAGQLPVVLLVSALLALAWLAAGRNAPGRGFLRRGAGRGSAGGAVSARWLAIGVPLIVMAAGGVTAVLTWLINNVWRPFPDLLPFTIVFWSWVALAGLALAVARQ